MRFIFLVTKLVTCQEALMKILLFIPKSDEAINNASRELYTNLKNKGVNVLHEVI